MGSIFFSARPSALFPNMLNPPYPGRAILFSLIFYQFPFLVNHLLQKYRGKSSHFLQGMILSGRKGKGEDCDLLKKPLTCIMDRSGRRIDFSSTSVFLQIISILAVACRLSERLLRFVLICAFLWVKHRAIRASGKIIFIITKPPVCVRASSASAMERGWKS